MIDSMHRLLHHLELSGQMDSLPITVVVGVGAWKPYDLLGLGPVS